jgi:regulator of sigma E protease
LFIAAYISINLGIVNLLPFPALDGGRIVFVIIEMIKGKPIDREKEGYVHFVGIVILMALMVFLVFRDISNL